jgi:hypothetical protein
LRASSVIFDDGSRVVQIWWNSDKSHFQICQRSRRSTLDLLRENKLLDFQSFTSLLFYFRPIYHMNWLCVLLMRAITVWTVHFCSIACQLEVLVGPLRLSVIIACAIIRPIDHREVVWFMMELFLMQYGRGMTHFTKLRKVRMKHRCIPLGQQTHSHLMMLVVMNSGGKSWEACFLCSWPGFDSYTSYCLFFQIFRSFSRTAYQFHIRAGGFRRRSWR